jgi:hypothetical protein
MSLPERQYTADIVQRSFERPQGTPPAVYTPQPIQPVPERRIVGYERYADGLLPVYEVVAPVERTPERDLTPQPLIDPRAQLVLAGGVAAGTTGAGVGWGIGQAATGIATLSGSSAILVALLLLLVAKARGTGRGGDTYNVTNHNRWWGKSTSITK